MFDKSVTENLIPALTQCFGIILIGFVFGRNNILHTHAAKGLVFFIWYLSLPALVFTTIATIPFSNVKWGFIASVLVGKCLVFIIVSVTTMFLTKPTHLGKAGLFAITATQSNDFALGYPLLVALYKNYRSNYPNFLYIIAPIQLLLLNPVGFVLLEIFKREQCSVHFQKKAFLYVIKGVLSNPIIVMTILGVIWNFTFNHYIPSAISQLLESLGASFAAIALFLLGYNMAQRVDLWKGKLSLPSILLVIVKILVLPLILQKITTFMLKGYIEQEIQDLSSLGFLYGTIPCAPSALVFASQYEVAVDEITSTTIFSTLFSAPLMLTSAMMISLSEYGFENTNFYLNKTLCFTSALNLFCTIWLLIVFFINKRWHTISYGATIYIVIAQFVMSIGGTAMFFMDKNSKYLFYFHYIMSTGGMFSSYIFASFLAVLLFLLQWRNVCFILRARYVMNIVVFIITFIASLAGVAASILTVNVVPSNYNLPFPFGQVQIIATLVIAFACLIITTVCLILQQRYKKPEHGSTNYLNERKNVGKEDKNLSTYVKISNEPVNENDNFKSKPSTSTYTNDVEDIGCNFVNCASNNPRNVTETSHLLCSSNFRCSVNQQQKCTALIEEYKKTLPDNDIDLICNQQTLKHIVLLVSFSASMFVSFAVCLWELVKESTNGVFIELEFLNVVLNYGQGIMCFIIFGLNSELLQPIAKFWRKLRHGNDIITDLATTALSPETTTTCNQFKMHHKKQCMQQIGKDITIGNTVHYSAFAGCDLVDWLLEVGLVQRRSKAEEYGSHLLEGCIIQHIDESRHFCDNSFMYKFIM